MTELLKYLRDLGRHWSRRGKHKVLMEKQNTKPEEGWMLMKTQVKAAQGGRLGSDDPPWTLRHRRNTHVGLVNLSFD